MLTSIIERWESRCQPVHVGDVPSRILKKIPIMTLICWIILKRTFDITNWQSSLLESEYKYIYIYVYIYLFVYIQKNFATFLRGHRRSEQKRHVSVAISPAVVDVPSSTIKPLFPIIKPKRDTLYKKSILRYGPYLTTVFWPIMSSCSYLNRFWGYLEGLVMCSDLTFIASSTWSARLLPPNDCFDTLYTVFSCCGPHEPPGMTCWMSDLKKNCCHGTAMTLRTSLLRRRGMENYRYGGSKMING